MNFAHVCLFFTLFISVFFTNKNVVLQTPNKHNIKRLRPFSDSEELKKLTKNIVSWI